ncbi:hypothetical protein F4801DRAFT_585322 [Xylaria longipes]|nr:hypothetical protein F4801DRAFT_585322 [Xylaria longipes]
MSVMLGEFEPIEHRRFPVLKFIDFGLAQERDNAVEENIQAIGVEMCELMWKPRDIAALIDDKKSANTLDPNLDSELLKLAAQCISQNPANRPSLQRLFTVVRQNTRKTYPNIGEETDAYISNLVRRYILDA